MMSDEMVQVKSKPAPPHSPPDLCNLFFSLFVDSPHLIFLNSLHHSSFSIYKSYLYKKSNTRIKINKENQNIIH
uniref:Uncharacterized protein n=1 Tax=Rhizophora mucronata TaxID=61149 RepID=A0A2P2KPC9_RHIMU